MKNQKHITAGEAPDFVIEQLIFFGKLFNGGY